MKRILFTVIAMVISAVCLNAGNKKDKKVELAHQLDSCITATAYRFEPDYIQLQPAGSRELIRDPHFEMTVNGDAIFITLPFYTGDIPPYIPVVLECNGPLSSDYTATREGDRWTVTFSSAETGSTVYRFKLEITARGNATLEVKSNYDPTVTFTGRVFSL